MLTISDIFQFIVDDFWFCNEAYSIAKDAAGNSNNVMRIMPRTTPHIDTTFEHTVSFSAPAAAAAPEPTKPFDVCAENSDARKKTPWLFELLRKVLFFWKK